MKEPSVDSLLAQPTGWASLEAIEKRLAGGPNAGTDERLHLAQIADGLLSSGDGAKLLEHLLDKTLRRPMVPVALPGQHPLTFEEIAPFVVFREGQNSIVQALLDLMRVARAARGK